MSGDLHVRHATPQDEPVLLDLLRASMGEEAVAWSPAYWRWKHVDNPFGASPVLVAEDAGRLVGLRAFMRWTWRSGGVEAAAVRAVDTATHPDYRGRGLFTRLTLQLRDEVAAEGAAFVFNTPNAQSRPGYLKMGWTLVGRPTLWMRVVHPVRFARTFRGGEEGAPPPVEAPPAAEVLRQVGMGALVATVSGRTTERLHTPLSLDYLRWRYADVPGFAYGALSRGEGAGGALVVLRTRRRGDLRELRLCDVVVGPTPAARRHARALLRQAARVADVDVVLAMSPAVPGGRRLLGATGYLPAPRTGPILTVYPFPSAAGLPDPRRLAGWHPSIGALELF